MSRSDLTGPRVSAGRRVAALVAASTALLLPAAAGRTDVGRPPAAAVAGSGTDFDDPEDLADAPRLAEVMPRSFGYGAKTSFRPSTHPRELLLSFDDGPDLKGTPLILDELDRRGLKAVFFVTGWRIAGERPADLARRDLVRKMAARGHLVANHSLNHKNLCAARDAQAIEIDGASEIITHATGVRPLLFRSPYGATCQSLQEALAARELGSVGWNLDPQDWRSENTEAILAYLARKLSTLQGRGILLLHDTHYAAVRSLPLVLDWIARDNERAVEEGRPPIVILDYATLLPERALPRTGLEIVMREVLENVTAPWRLVRPGPAALGAGVPAAKR